MAIQLTLLLISCSLYSMYSSSFSTSSSLALLVLVISTCLSLLFSNLRQLIKTSSHKTSMEAVAHQEKSTVPQDEVPEDAPMDSAGSLSGSSDCQVSEEWTDEVSVSDDDDDDDDESLIEISLVDGYYVGQEEQCLWKKEQDLLADFLPEFVLGRRDFIDILSEISEEENMIEIDIARGSIKCTNFSIKA
ncbi:uncharacterized protein LOC123442829 [Hordeum vulgare subsp. vulgare]|uniref:Uncharacterized protein n=1 Tax=Hordeum vulgare subsp. vulgare TaxID=112509 RepID=M0YZ16_HORVV|nr:uncharacterized protein LOC123442829 [Hordeum vulgare subsp. vulgare]